MIKFRRIKNMEYREVLIELVKLFQPDIYVEIGVQHGYTFNMIAPLVKAAFSIDPVMRPTVLRRFNVCNISMTSDDALELLQQKEIDFLFIDGLHSEEQTRKDFLNYFPLVTAGTGLIFLHDTHPGFADLVGGDCGECWKVAKWLRAKAIDFGIEVITLPGPHAGMTLVRKLKNGNHFSWRDDEWPP